MKKLTGALVAIAIIALCIAARNRHRKQTVDWPVYGGQLAGDHYSALSQINRENVTQLRVAWKFDTGEQGGMQTSPIIVGGVLYAYTPSQKVIALDAATGTAALEVRLRHRRHTARCAVLLTGPKETRAGFSPES